MQTRWDILVDMLRGNKNDIKSNLRRIFNYFETFFNGTIDINRSNHTTIEISVSSEDLVREKCRNSRGSHKSWDCICNTQLFIESLELTSVSVGHTDRKFTLLFLSELFIKERSKRISFEERFFEDETLNNTSQVVSVDIWFLDVLPEINYPSSHCDGVFLSELAKTSSVDCTNGDT